LFPGNASGSSFVVSGLIFVSIEEVPELWRQTLKDEVSIGLAVDLVDGLKGSSVENGLKLSDDFRPHLKEVARVNSQAIIWGLKKQLFEKSSILNQK
jgi:hypothetical protein